MGRVCVHIGTHMLSKCAGCARAARYSRGGFYAQGRGPRVLVGLGRPQLMPVKERERERLCVSVAKGVATVAVCIIEEFGCR